MTGDLQLKLEYIPSPNFTDGDGRTTISTRVAQTKYLLFTPEGLQWQYKSYMGVLDELSEEHPTLINGVAWWPIPDKRNAQEWMSITQTSRTPLLKTRAFAWTAKANGLRPSMVSSGGSTGSVEVTLSGPTTNTPSLAFVALEGAQHEVQCVISRSTP